MGSFAFLPNAPRSFGRNTVWVGSVPSDAMRALNGPVPPSSTVRLAVSAETAKVLGGASVVEHPLSAISSNPAAAREEKSPILVIGLLFMPSCSA